MDNHVIIHNVSFAWGDRPVLESINITIPRGKITAIMGVSGSGKSTLLQLIGGQLTPSAGKICIDGVDIHALSQKKRYALRRSMGLLFQEGGLFTDLNVFENVAFPLREHTDLPEEMLHDVVLMKLEAVGLRGARCLMPSELSGGMARRVALARALALDPSLMMYDEPFTGQDPITMGVLVKLIKQLNQILGLTSILVSHDVPETASIADYIYLIGQGGLLAEGSPDALSRSKSAGVKQFMDGLPDGPASFHYPADNYVEDLAL